MRGKAGVAAGKLVRAVAYGGMIFRAAVQQQCQPDVADWTDIYFQLWISEIKSDFLCLAMLNPFGAHY